MFKPKQFSEPSGSRGGTVGLGGCQVPAGGNWGCARAEVVVCSGWSSPGADKLDASTEERGAGTAPPRSPGTPQERGPCSPLLWLAAIFPTQEHFLP